MIFILLPFPVVVATLHYFFSIDHFLIADLQSLQETLQHPETKMHIKINAIYKSNGL